MSFRRFCFVIMVKGRCRRVCLVFWFFFEDVFFFVEFWIFYEARSFSGQFFCFSSRETRLLQRFFGLVVMFRFLVLLSFEKISFWCLWVCRVFLGLVFFIARVFFSFFRFKGRFISFRLFLMSLIINCFRVGFVEQVQMFVLEGLRRWIFRQLKGVIVTWAELIRCWLFFFQVMRGLRKRFVGQRSIIAVLGSRYANFFIIKCSFFCLRVWMQIFFAVVM